MRNFAGPIAILGGGEKISEKRDLLEIMTEKAASRAANRVGLARGSWGGVFDALDSSFSGAWQHVCPQGTRN